MPSFLKERYFGHAIELLKTSKRGPTMSLYCPNKFELSCGWTPGGGQPQAVCGRILEGLRRVQYTGLNNSNRALGVIVVCL